MKITKEHVDKALNEVARRITIDIEDGLPADEIRNAVMDKIDGVNATFMMISDNWPETSAWLEKGCDERGLYDY